MILRIVKCHYYYLFTKLLIWIMIIITVVSLFNDLSIILSLDNTTVYEASYIYFYSTYEIIKLSVNIFSVILIGYSFLSSNDQYRCFIISKVNKRSTYFLSKILLLAIVIFVFLSFQIAISLIIGFINKVNIPYILLFNYIYLYQSCLYFGFLTLFIILLSDNLYTIFFSIFLVIITSSIDTDSFIKYFIIIINENIKNDFFYNSLLIILLLIFNTTFYINKDLPI